MFLESRSKESETAFARGEMEIKHQRVLTRHTDRDQCHYKVITDFEVPVRPVSQPAVKCWLVPGIYNDKNCA